MRNMHDVVKSLGSEKVKDRQEGLIAIREVFSQDRAVENFAVENGTVRQENFMLVFQSLFRVVGKEKDLATRSSHTKTVSTTAALRRLSESANTLRWLIDRTVHLMNGKVATTCTKHLVKFLLDGDKIFDSVALDYAKALRCILGHSAHLDHLNEESWLSIVSLAFNIVLGDPIQRQLLGEDEMEVINEVDSDMYAEDTAEDEHNYQPSTSKGKKRARSNDNPLPILSPRKSQKMARKKRPVIVTVSLEQVEFISVLRLLLSAPNAPLLSMNQVEGDHETDDDVGTVVLQRLQRFLEIYSADSSLLRDYIAILSSVLDHISFNKVIAVQSFAWSTWDCLISLWSTKDKSMKENLLIVFKQLFPFVTCPSITEQKLPNFDLEDSISRLWHLLDSEAENRWGVDGLSLDVLRLEISGQERLRQSAGGFVAKTFQAGWNFDAAQVLSWAILQLQADCTATLFVLSESMHSTRLESKRTKAENPILSLLDAIQTRSANHVRSYHLQVLLFFIDQHWDIVHDSLKQQIVDLLLQFVVFIDPAVQSWVFLNFAAIVHAEAFDSRKTSPLITSDKWDTIWTHTVRRVNVPGVCRAACHAGYTILLASYKSSKSNQGFISHHRMLLEIEALLKDMDVQGPSYPFDSVCAFLAQGLTIAAQDVRLYRMRLEDKVISWFVDNWKIVGTRSKMVPNTLADVLHLLETICGLSKRSIVSNRVLLPQTAIVDHMMEEGKTKIIRDFVLQATLPVFDLNRTRPPYAREPVGTNKDKVQIGSPRAKERKLSAFFLRALEGLLTEWDHLKDQNPTAEMARRSLDFTLAAIIFESLLAFNGTTINRDVLQLASKVILIITPLLLKQTWVLAEKVLVAQAFEQLVFDIGSSEQDAFQSALPLPGEYSGIKERLLRGLVGGHSTQAVKQENQVNFLKHIWQNEELQETLPSVMTTFRTLLRQLLESSGSQDHAMDVDDKDGFAPIRTTTRPPEFTNVAGIRLFQQLMQICISFLACGPYLQSSAGKPTRDSELMQLIAKSAQDPDKFKVACPVLFRFVRQKIFHSSVKTLNQCLLDFGDIFRKYSYSKQQSIIISFLDFLHSALIIWKVNDDLAKDVHSHLREFYSWLSRLLVKGTCRSWALRDAIARFFSQYLEENPTLVTWTGDSEEDVDEQMTPAAFLPKLSNDRDVRVRFRAAIINAGLFSISHHFGQESLNLYETMKDYFPPYLEKYEHMLTRLLALGNILVVSAPVRRGAYWHMLETCIFSSSYSYSSHIETILLEVSRRLGMPSLSTLFSAYASQLAFSLRQLDADFLRFPPHLLGYQDRRQCAEAIFRSFTPCNILTQGEKVFEAHCKLLQKDMLEGIRECFGDIIGLQIANYAHLHPEFPTNLDQLLVETFSFLPSFTLPFEDNLDSITATILRSLGDQDFGTGPESITAVLHMFDSTLVTTFQTLVKHRKYDTLVTHSPNRPAFGTLVVLRSLRWLSTRWGGFSIHTTYHVLQQLFHDLNSTPLVNEQMRLINALSLWIAFRRGDFIEPTIADSLIRGCTFLLSQSDLAQSAQSILEWAFSRYPAPKSWKESRLPNILVRIRCIAQDFSSEANGDTISPLGEDLVKWMDSQMMAFSRKPAYRSLVLRVLPTWPQQPSVALTKLYDDISVFDLTSILEDHRITSNKFRLVRRLQESALLQGQEEEDFAGTYFWRLKECIPPPDQLQEGDVDAFASLLSYHHGQIGSLNVEEPDQLSPRNRHLRNVKKRATAEDTYAAHDAITLGLLVMLDDDDPLRVFNAYYTLRLAFSVSDKSYPHASLIVPQAYRQDIECLKCYKRSPTVRAIPNVQEALASEKYIEYSSRFTEWVSQISILLSDALAKENLVFGQLSIVLAFDIDFAEQVLPILIHTILQKERQEKNGTKPIRTALSEYFTKILSSSSIDNRCISSIVDIVLHLRNILPVKAEALAYNKWLEIDFSLLARSAILCGAFTTALLFVELASEHDNSFVPDSKETEHVLYEIYAHIDEPDGFYGIKAQDLQQFLVKRFHHEKQYDKAFRFHAASLEVNSLHNQDQIGLLQSFHSFGFDHLAIDTLRYFRESEESLSSSSMNYELGWRTETWDLPDNAADAVGTALYRSLRAIYRERDSQILDQTIRTALYDEMERLRTLGSENLVEIRVVSQNLLCLREILQWRRQYAAQLQHGNDLEVNQWQSLVQIDENFDFPELEGIMATRISLVRSVRQREERERIGTLVSPLLGSLLDIEQKCLLRLSSAARSSDQIQIALNSVVRAQKLDGSHKLEVNEEFANVLWLQKEEKAAVQFLQNVLKKQDSQAIEARSHYALLTSRLGTWTSEACLEKPSDIWEHYFSRSIDLLDSIKMEGPDIELTKATVYRECAMFAEGQYHAVLKSPDALRWKLYVERKTSQLASLSKEISRTQIESVKADLEHEQMKAQRLLQTDSELFRKHDNLRETFLKQAIEMHSRCLETCDKFNEDSAIRLCSLWFANFEDESIQDTVSNALDRTPSGKLVFLAHQITARVSNPIFGHLSGSQEILQRLVIRMCQEHPFHTLYQLWCISDHHPPDKRGYSGHLSQSTQTERSSAATTILDRLREDKVSGKRVKDIEIICAACLEWAKYPIRKNTGYRKNVRGGFAVPSGLKILKIPGPDVRVPVLTERVPLDPTLKYENCVWIDRYSRTFETLGGVNLPKVSICHGSNGKNYKQLFKGEGNDDLRQDAVMEQVFDLVNSLLLRDRETKRRDLRVRGYVIIPLSNQAGLLEFIGNTTPLKDWLNKAHVRYHPNDFKNEHIGKVMKEMKDSHQAPEKLLEEFLKFCKRFHPVLRYYFTERHKSPIPWFTTRLAYTRSVATTSIVGHVLGLGDRHSSNILIDHKTGEVAHIDLGIAFDQGKLLTVPETVPFRMTGDIVDGMGISGTAGVFQRCAEETLRVLREESGVIMTVLEVFKHDPLHSWTVSEIKMKQIQSDMVPPTPVMEGGNTMNTIGGMNIGIDMSSGSADEAADRALNSVARKLDKSLSVQSTVNELIAEATDPMNLATLFAGWCAWM